MLSFYLMVFMALTKNFSAFEKHYPEESHRVWAGLYTTIIVLFPIIGLPMTRFYMLRRGRRYIENAKKTDGIINMPPSHFFEDLCDSLMVWKNEPLIQIYFNAHKEIPETREM